MNEILPAGPYVLNFHDPVGANHTYFSCASYTFTYALTPLGEVPPTCDAAVLPTDLNSTYGISLKCYNIAV